MPTTARQKYTPGTVLRLPNHRGHVFHVVVLPHLCGCCYQLLDLHQQHASNVPESRTIHEWGVGYVEANAEEWRQDKKSRVTHGYYPDAQ